MGSLADPSTSSAPKASKGVIELLYTSLEEEKNIDSLPLDGKMPGWLRGNFVRNGPALFEIGTDVLKHWFDGQAMLHSFSFDGANGKIGYRNKFVQSSNYKAHKKAGKIAAAEFVSKPKKNFLQKIGNLIGGLEQEVPYENVNVNVENMNGHAIAYTETPRQLEFDPKTVETLGVLQFEDDAKTFESQTSTAHPVIAPNGDFINFGTAFGKDNFYKIYRVKNNGGPNRREMIAKVMSNPMPYHHAFSVSNNYIVLAESPYYFSLSKMLMGQVKGFFLDHQSAIGDIFEWDHKAPARFLVVRQSDGEVMGRFDAPSPFLSYHHANCYEEGDLIHVDLMCYEKTDAYDDMLLDNLRKQKSGMDLFEGEVGQVLSLILSLSCQILNPKLWLGSSTLRRYTINLKAKGDSPEAVSMTVLFDGVMEFCRINEKYRGNADYRYIYAVCSAKSDKAWSAISKIDVHTKEVKTFDKENCALGEPVFIPNPSPSSEDDGVVVAVLLNGNTQKSELVGLDGRTFKVLFTAEIPHHIPMGLHGQHFA